jgi:hypothetical protein
VLGTFLGSEFDPSDLEVKLINDSTFDGKFAVVLENTGELLYEKPNTIIASDPNLTEMEQLMMISKIGTWMAEQPRE